MVFFFGVKNDNGYLSNWYPCEFSVDGVKFTSSEQFMMYYKALLFGDMEIANKILSTSNCKDIKALGRQVRGFDETMWNLNKKQIMYNGLLAKFSQNRDLASKLISTGNEILAEASPYDKIWGIGLSTKDNRRFDKNRWLGQNLLGEILMMVRYTLANSGV